MLKCPTNPDKDKADWPGETADQPLGITCSYAGARYDGTHKGVFPFGPSGPAGTADGAIQTPASTIDVVESTATFPDFDVNNPGYFACQEDTSACFFGYAGDLFAGHVKAMRPLSTIDKAEGGAGSLNMWTIDNGPFDSADVSGVDQVLTFSQSRYN